MVRFACFYSVDSIESGGLLSDATMLLLTDVPWESLAGPMAAWLLVVCFILWFCEAVVSALDANCCWFCWMVLAVRLVGFLSQALFGSGCGNHRAPNPPFIAEAWNLRIAMLFFCSMLCIVVLHEHMCNKLKLVALLRDRRPHLNRNCN